MITVLCVIADLSTKGGPKTFFLADMRGSRVFQRFRTCIPMLRRWEIFVLLQLHQVLCDLLLLFRI